MDRLGQLLASLGCSWDGLDLVAVFSRRNPDHATENLSKSPEAALPEMNGQQ
jgi:hypothetical protein